MTFLLLGFYSADRLSHRFEEGLPRRSVVWSFSSTDAARVSPELLFVFFPLVPDSSVCNLVSPVSFLSAVGPPPIVLKPLLRGGVVVRFGGSEDARNESPFSLIQFCSLN